MRRPWHRLSVDVLQDGLVQSKLALCQPDCWTDMSVDQLALLYDSEITSLLDEHIPARTVTIRHRSSDLWFDSDCRQAKRDVRRLQRLARRCGTPDATAAWTSKRREYRALRRQKREAFWHTKVAAEKSSPHQLWRSIDALLGRGSAPPSNDISADEFHRFFDDKVARVRSATADAPPPSFQSTSPGAPLHAFQPVSVSDVVTAVRALPDRSCSLDVLPTRLLKTVIDTIAPFVTELFNRSLLNGRVPEVFKGAYVTPRIKKAYMDPTDPRAHRPISNLPVIYSFNKKLSYRRETARQLRMST